MNKSSSEGNSASTKAVSEILYEKETHHILDQETSGIPSASQYIASSSLIVKWDSTHDMKLERSIYEVLLILVISLTDKPHQRERKFFDKSNFKNVNFLCDSSEPNLFNF